MDTFTVKDPALVKRFSEVVETKSVEAQQLPYATEGYHCTGDGEDHHHDFATFVLCGMEDTVKVMHDSLGHHRLMFGNETVPAYEVCLNQDGVLEVEFAGEAEQLPDLVSQLQLASGLPVFLNELVPYGWVKDGRITVIFYGDDFHQREQDGMIINDHSVDCHVLEGEHLPIELGLTDDADAWTAQLWDLVKQGKLIRLSERIDNLPGEMWAMSDGKRLYFEFETSDGQSPELVAGKPYISWHPAEALPGQKLSAADVNGGEPYQRYLKGWFR